VDKSNIVLTARSGRAALAYRSKEVGFNLSKDELDIAYNHFISLADIKKEVNEDDLSKMLNKIFVPA